jgi:ATP synthase protein I
MAASDEGPDRASSPSVSDTELGRRRARLSRDLAAELEERAAAEAPRRSDSTNYGAAFRMASEFVAGVLVGAALGWGVDRLFGTSPWGLIGFLLLGFAAGVLNVVRASGNLSAGGKSGGDPNPQ